MSEYKVYILIKGALHRPPYYGCVTVHVDSQEEIVRAAWNAVKQTFFDASRSDMVIKSVVLVLDNMTVKYC